MFSSPAYAAKPGKRQPLKAFLEHGIELKLVEDHAPEAHVKGRASQAK